MGSWKAGRPKNPKGNFIVTGMTMSGLLGSRKDNKSWVQKIYGGKSFESITDSQLKLRPWRCSSWIVTPNSIFHPDRLSDLFMSWMSLQEKKSGNGFLKPTNVSHGFPFGSTSHLENIGSWKAGSPASNPLWLKAQSRQWFIGKHCIVTNLGDHNCVTKPSASLH